MINRRRFLEIMAVAIGGSALTSAFPILREPFLDIPVFTGPSAKDDMDMFLRIVAKEATHDLSFRITNTPKRHHMVMFNWEPGPSPSDFYHHYLRPAIYVLRTEIQNMKLKAMFPLPVSDNHCMAVHRAPNNAIFRMINHASLESGGLITKIDFAGEQ